MGRGTSCISVCVVPVSSFIVTNVKRHLKVSKDFVQVVVVGSSQRYPSALKTGERDDSDVLWVSVTDPGMLLTDL